MTGKKFKYLFLTLGLLNSIAYGMDQQEPSSNRFSPKRLRDKELESSGKRVCAETPVQGDEETCLGSGSVPRLPIHPEAPGAMPPYNASNFSFLNTLPPDALEAMIESLIVQQYEVNIISPFKEQIAADREKTEQNDLQKRQGLSIDQETIHEKLYHKIGVVPFFEDQGILETLREELHLRHLFFKWAHSPNSTFDDLIIEVLDKLPNVLKKAFRSHSIHPSSVTPPTEERHALLLSFFATPPKEEMDALLELGCMSAFRKKFNSLSDPIAQKNLIEQQVKLGNEPAILEKLYGLMRGKYGYIQDPAAARDLIEDLDLKGNKAAFRSKVRGLANGAFGYSKDPAAARAFIEEQEKLGNNEALEVHLEGLRLGGYGYEKNISASHELIESYRSRGEERVFRFYAEGLAYGWYDYRQDMEAPKKLIREEAQKGKKEAIEALLQGLIYNRYWMGEILNENLNLLAELKEIALHTNRRENTTRIWSTLLEAALNKTSLPLKTLLEKLTPHYFQQPSAS